VFIFISDVHTYIILKRVWTKYSLKFKNELNELQ
jgi:hypothetical protein